MSHCGEGLVNVHLVGRVLGTMRVTPLDPPPTVDHPLTESVMLLLAAKKLLIKVTHQSATNEPGRERKRARSQEQDGKE